MTMQTRVWNNFKIAGSTIFGTPLLLRFIIWNESHILWSITFLIESIDRNFYISNRLFLDIKRRRMFSYLGDQGQHSSGNCLGAIPYLLYT